MKDSDFRKSAWSNKRFKPACVLVAQKRRGVALRDSKDPKKKTLFFGRSEWNAFVKGVKGGQFD